MKQKAKMMQIEREQKKNIANDKEIYQIFENNMLAATWIDDFGCP